MAMRNNNKKLSSLHLRLKSPWRQIFQLFWYKYFEIINQGMLWKFCGYYEMLFTECGHLFGFSFRYVCFNLQENGLNYTENIKIKL